MSVTKPGATRRQLLKAMPAAAMCADTIMAGLERRFEQLERSGPRGESYVPPRPVTMDAAANTLLGFTNYTFFGFDQSWHHEKLGRVLDDFVAGKIPRLMIFMPPRHSKSEFVSRRLPAYIFGKRPRSKIIAASYTADLAHAMSRDVQRIIDSPAYEKLFPKTKIEGKKTDALFEINGGGEMGGSYRAAGVNVGISGMGADYAIIDDPIKDAAEAGSKTYRDAVYEWYTSTLYTRLENPGAVLITMTRWHEDDLAGRLLKLAKDDPTADQWVVLDLPALAVEAEQRLVAKGGYSKPSDPDYLGDPRQVGEALWPARFPLERLKQIERTIGDWFTPLYQQRPTTPGGKKFKREWFRIVTWAELPKLRVRSRRFCRFWDAAGTPGGGDWTVGALLLELTMEKEPGHPADLPPDKIYVVVDVLRGQWDDAGVMSMIYQAALQDRARFGAVRIREETEPGSSGLAVVKQRRRRLNGFDYDGKRSTGAKSARWSNMAAAAKAGNVLLLEGAWNYEFLEELVRVKDEVADQQDDQADAASGAYNELAVGTGQMSVVGTTGVY